MTDVQGRTAFITGGASDLGLSIARALARAGASIALADIDSDRLALARAELGAATPVATFVVDVRSREALSGTARKVEHALGPVSLLFNIAYPEYRARVEDLTFDRWDQAVDTTLGGVINSVRTFLPPMIERGEGGHIVNSTSTAGLAGADRDVLRATTDFGIVGLSESMGPELADSRIGVSLLCWDSVPATPDAVGELVLRGVRENSFYIHTDRSAEQRVRMRTDALIAAMPEARP